MPIVTISDYATLGDLCAHYATSDDKIRKQIAAAVFRYVLGVSCVPSSMAVLHRTDRYIEMSSILADEEPK